jgi:hypothetical protein
MPRREFIAWLTGASATIAPSWRHVSCAQKPNRTRHIGVMETAHVTRWIGGVLAIAVIFGSVASTCSIAASRAGIQKLQTTPTDVSAPRHYHRPSYYAYRPYYPYYYGRPYYYSPGPFFLPVPPFWGYGWQWW